MFMSGFLILFLMIVEMGFIIESIFIILIVLVRVVIEKGIVGVIYIGLFLVLVFG